jgi:hypothetical protein
MVNCDRARRKQRFDRWASRVIRKSITRQDRRVKRMISREKSSYTEEEEEEEEERHERKESTRTDGSSSAFIILIRFKMQHTLF